MRWIAHSFSITFASHDQFMRTACISKTHTDISKVTIFLSTSFLTWVYLSAKSQRWIHAYAKDLSRRGYVLQLEDKLVVSLRWCFWVDGETSRCCIMKVSPNWSIKTWRSSLGWPWMGQFSKEIRKGLLEFALFTYFFS